MTAKKSILQGLLGISGAMACVTGSAQPAWNANPPDRVIEDRLRVEIGTSWMSFSTEARIDNSADEPGTPFDGEADFGLKEARLLPMAELTLLPGERHLVRLSSLRVHRSGKAVLSRDIDYGGDLFEAGELVTSSIDLRLTGLTYAYQFLKRPRGYLAGSFGMQIAEFNVNADIPGEFIGEPTGEIAPLPMLGLEGRLDLSPRWSVDGRLQYTSISLDLIEGTLLDARLGALWRLNPHVALGLAYRTFNIDAESFDDDSAGLVNLKMSGPMFFVSGSL